MEQETLHNFDRFTHDQMSEEEKRSFGEKLESDAVLQQEFNEYLQIVNGINEYEREQLKAFLKDKQSRSLYGSNGWDSVKRMAAAAAIILVLVIPGYILFRTTTYPSRLVKEYKVDDPGLPVQMGASAHPMLDQAMVEFKDGQFEASLLKIQQLLVSNPDNDTLLYYAGLCYFETRRNADAIAQFEKIASKSSRYYIQAKYNEGLSYIREKNYDAAKKCLNEVAGGEDGPLKQKAKELLNRI